MKHCWTKLCGSLLLLASVVGSIGNDTPTRTASSSLSTSTSALHTHSTTLSISPSKSHSHTATMSCTNSASNSQTVSHSTTATLLSTRSKSLSSVTTSATLSQTSSLTKTSSSTLSVSPSLTATTSSSPSGTLSRVLSESETRGPTLSESMTSSRSASRSPTLTYSSTQSSLSFSALLSGSLSRTASRSFSTTKSSSVSSTMSRTATPSGSTSASFTTTVSGSAQITISLTPSPSYSGSESANVTKTITPPNTTTRSHSASETFGSLSRDASLSRSSSFSCSPSIEWSASVTDSHSPSASTSPTQELSASPTLSGTFSNSTSPSLSAASPSMTSTRTPSVTATSELSQTRTRTASVSVTHSRSATYSQSLTVTQSASRTFSASATHSGRSPTPTVSPSFSSSSSVTNAVSASTTNTQSLSVSRSVSIGTLTGEVSSSLTGSVSGTADVSSTQSESESPSLTRTRSTTVSASPSETSQLSITTTESASSSASVTNAMSASTTNTQSRSASWSVSFGTLTGEVSSSLTRSVSGTADVTSTRSESESLSFTRTRSTTVSASPSETSQQSLTATETSSVSSTNDVSSSESEDMSLTRSSTSDVSTTATATSSLSVSNELTSTASLTDSPTLSSSPTASVSAPASATVSTSATSTKSFSPSDSPSPSSSDSVSPSFSPEPSVTSSSSESQSRSVSASVFPSATSTVSMSRGTFTEEGSSSVTASTSRTVGSLSQSVTASPSPSNSGSETVSWSRSVTLSTTESPDPCNVTYFENNSQIAKVSVINDPGGGVPYPFGNESSIFFQISRVSLGQVGNLFIEYSFNTPLRNMYGQMLQRWSPPPSTTNCRLTNFSLVNEFTIRLGLAYVANERIGVGEDYLCNMTFINDAFQCRLLTKNQYNFTASLFVKAPETALSFWDNMARIAGTVAGILTGGAALLHQSRANSINSFADCQFSLIDELSIGDNPLQLGLGDPVGYYLRGSVIGNAVFFVLVVIGHALIVLLLVVRSYFRDYDDPNAKRQGGETDKATVLQSDSTLDNKGQQSSTEKSESKGTGVDDDPLPQKMLRSQFPLREEVLHQAAVARFPSASVAAAVLTYDGTCTASMALILHPQMAMDRPLGVFGLCMAVAFVVVLLVVTKIVFHCEPLKLQHDVMDFVTTEEDEDDEKKKEANPHVDEDPDVAYARMVDPPAAPKADAKTDDKKKKYPSVFRRIQFYLFNPRMRWVQAEGHPYFKGMFLSLFHEYTFATFACAEVALSLIIGAASGVMISKREVCNALAGLSLACLLIFIAAIVYINPFINRMDLYHAFVANACAFFGSIFLFIYSRQTNPDVRLTNYATTLATMVSVVNVLKFILDIADRGKQVRGRFSAEARRKTAESRKKHLLTVLRARNAEIDNTDGGLRFAAEFSKEEMEFLRKSGGAVLDDSEDPQGLLAIYTHHHTTAVSKENLPSRAIATEGDSILVNAPVVRVESSDSSSDTSDNSSGASVVLVREVIDGLVKKPSRHPLAKKLSSSSLERASRVVLGAMGVAKPSTAHLSVPRYASVAGQAFHKTQTLLLNENSKEQLPDAASMTGDDIEFLMHVKAAARKDAEWFGCGILGAADRNDEVVGVSGSRDGAGLSDARRLPLDVIPRPVSILVEAAPPIPLKTREEELFDLL